jgi:hypothetical protein
MEKPTETPLNSSGVLPVLFFIITTYLEQILPHTGRYRILTSTFSFLVKWIPSLLWLSGLSLLDLPSYVLSYIWGALGPNNSFILY